MMTLCGHSTLGVLFPSRVFVPQVETMDGWDVAAKCIWKSRAPTKVCFFACTASKGEIPTEDNLKRRNFSGSIRCSMCGQILWIISLCIIGGFLYFGIYLSLMGVGWVQPSNMIPLAILLATWKKRKQHIFENIIKLCYFKIISCPFQGCCVVGVSGLMVTKT